LPDEEPVLSEVEGTWASRATRRILCGAKGRVWLASFLSQLVAIRLRRILWPELDNPTADPA